MSPIVEVRGTRTHPCGCVSLAAMERWVSMCPAHEAAYQETRARWLRERAESQSDGEAAK